MWIGLSILLLCFILALARAIWLEAILKESRDNLAWEMRAHERTKDSLEQAKSLIEGLDARCQFETHRRWELEGELNKVNTAVSKVGWAKAWN